MTRRDDLTRLKDIEQSILAIERHPLYSMGKTAYDEDEYFRAAIYLHVERLCEAVTALVRDHQYDRKYPDVPWEEIVGMRIILAHHYWNMA